MFKRGDIVEFKRNDNIHTGSICRVIAKSNTLKRLFLRVIRNDHILNIIGNTIDAGYDEVSLVDRRKIVCSIKGHPYTKIFI